MLRSGVPSLVRSRPSFSLVSVSTPPPLSLSSLFLSLCCSVLLSPTNDASHPQTHQLTLFQSYRTSPAFPPSSLPLSLSLWAASLSFSRYRAAESTVVTYVSSLPFSSRSSPSLSLSLSLPPPPVPLYPSSRRRQTKSSEVQTSSQTQKQTPGRRS